MEQQVDNCPEQTKTNQKQIKINQNQPNKKQTKTKQKKYLELSLMLINITCETLDVIKLNNHAITGGLIITIVTASHRMNYGIVLGLYCQLHYKKGV